MRLDQLFDYSYGNKFDFNKMTPRKNGIAFVGRKGLEQGISGFVKPIEGVKAFEPGLLTVALGGSMLLATFVQHAPFYTAQNVAVLKPRREMSLEERLYFAMCIQSNRFRYSAFGREANRTLKQMLLPDEVPAWVHEKANRLLPELTGSLIPQRELLTRNTWKEMTLGTLFEIKKGTRLTKRNMKEGSIPYIGSSAMNNGVTQYIDATPEFPGKVLTVPYDGSVGHAFYQPKPFCASDAVHVLIPKDGLNDIYSLLFLASVIRHEKYRFNYGRKWTLDRMRNSLIRLPVTDLETPDWEYMSSFMKGLRFSSTLR